MRKAMGRYVVIDSSICHGQATFKGTRIMVKDILEQVASGQDWESIVDDWRGSIKKPAIAEAVRLASEAFARQDELALEAADS